MYNRLFCISCLIFISVWLHGQSHVPIFHGDLKYHLGTNGALTGSGSGFSWLEKEDDENWRSLVPFGGLWIGGLDEIGGNLRFADLMEGGTPGPIGADWGMSKFGV
jgi:hypothetical protein